MIVSVKEQSGRKIRIVVPTGLLLNWITAYFIPGALEKKGITLTRGQLLAVIRELRNCKRRNRGWKLIEVEAAGGEYVEISL